jgi:bifunctional DNA-binding transcriptional regulator/antitoxin component of YhaV-PrlF toxin-antitoxin module
MARSRSTISADGLVAVPADVMRKLGVGPGSMIEWDEEGGRVTVRRAGRYTSEDIHRALFPEGPPKGPPVDVKEAIRAHIRKKHARD